MTAHHEFDHLLDRALSEYRDAEPLAGMEDRVLDRLASHRHPSRFGWLRWIATATCAAAVLMVAVLLLRSDRTSAPSAQTAVKPHPETTQPTTMASAQPPATPPLFPPKPVSHSARSASSPQPRVGGPKPVLDQFPTPAPLNSSEKTLLALAAYHPDVLDRTPADQEIKIAPIYIRPLAEDSSSRQGEN